MLLIRRLPLVIAFAQPVFAQPYSVPPKPPEFATADADGNGTLSPNDFTQFQNKYNAAMVWQKDVQTNAPGQPRNLAANVAAQTVTLSWVNDSRPQTAVYVLRGGSVIQTLPATATTTTDQPGGGTWQYSVTTGNQVIPYIYSPMGSAPVVTALVTGQPPPPSSGWTDTTLPPGALAFYVSNSGGMNSNSGSQASPLKTIEAGYAKVRDGFPDQVLLKCGDTWTETIAWKKSAISDTQYMVLGSYGTGPRPRLNVNGSIGVYLDHNRRGLAIVGIDFQGPGNGTGFTGITGFSPASHILVEGCRFDGLPTGIVFQETNQPDRIRDLKIRRNVFSNIVDTGGGHSQGVFIGNADEMVIEGNVSYKIALNKADGFCHANYLSETDGPSVFSGNIMGMSCSHGVQQRSGGRMVNNLALRNPINYFQGNSPGAGSTAPVNYCAFNVALDSRNINPTTGRGFGYVLEGAPGSVVEYNVAAYQVTGTDAILAYDFDHWQGSRITGNVAWDWNGPNAGNPGWVGGFQMEAGFSSNAVISGNTIVNHLNGMLFRYEAPVSGSFSGNKYWTNTPDSGVGGYMRFATDQGVGATLEQWRSRTGDQSQFLSSAPAQVQANIGDYLQSIGVNPGTDPMATFMEQAILQSKQNWRDAYTAPVVNNWIRSRFGMANPSNP